MLPKLIPLPLVPVLPKLAPLPARAPSVICAGEGVAVVIVGDVIRIDITSDDGLTRCTRFVTKLEAQQLVTALARLSK